MATDRRFDNRSKETFKQDIAFSTALENYLFNKWVNHACSNTGIKIEYWGENGCGNDGSFIESGKSTFGADFIISMFYYGNHYENLPLELKFVPTAGKFTLKKNDLKAYAKENAAILFIYNTKNCSLNLRKPKDYNLDNHIKRIESKSNDIKWGIIFPDIVHRILGLTNRFKPIQYMGGKEGIVIHSNEFDELFDQHEWR